MSKEFSTPALNARLIPERLNLRGTKCDSCGNLMIGKRAVCTGCSKPITKPLEVSRSSR